jgi:cytochrome P450
MAVVLRTILDNCRLAPARRRQERQQRRAVTLQPRHGTRVTVKTRNPRFAG